MPAAMPTLRFVALLLMLLPTQALAFAVALSKDTTGQVVRWKKPAMTYWLHPACSTDLPAGPCLDEVRKSFQAWSAPCTNATFSESGMAETVKLTSTGYNGDGKNVVAWIENSAWEYGKYTLGVTTPVFYDDGTIIEADIAMNGYSQTWSMSGKVNSTDVRNVAVHEIGHYFGMQHMLGGYDPDNPPTMAPTADPFMKSQTPEPDDLAGLCFLYPAVVKPCTGNADCPLIVADGAKGEFYAGQLACSGGKCGGFDPNPPKGNGPLGSKCVADLDCQEPLFCQPMQSSAGVCAHQCKPNTSGACPSGFVCTPYAGDPNDGVCIAGQAPGTKQEGEPCDSGKQCASGLCIIESGGPVCRTPCTGSKACASGKACAAIPGKPYGVCVDAKKGIGEACTASSQCDSGLCSQNKCAPMCFSNQDCAPGLVCKTQGGGGSPSGPGTCVPAPTKLADGAACGASSECASNLCVGAGGGAVCVQGCSANKPCAAGFDCYPLQNGGVSPGITGACLKAAEKKPAGLPCKGGSDCKSNLCVTTSPTSGTCMDECSAAPCPAGFSCQKLQGTKSACFPLGNAQLGDACQEHLDCQSALCLIEGGKSYCATSCKASADCPCGMACVDGGAKLGFVCVKGKKVACVPNGAPCAAASECQSGACSNGVCGAVCSIFQASMCPAGQKCLRGAADNAEGLCGAVGSKGLNAPCGKDAECATGFCHGGKCGLPCNPFGPNKCSFGLVCTVAASAVGACTVAPPVTKDASLGEDTASDSGTTTTPGDASTGSEVQVTNEAQSGSTPVPIVAPPPSSSGLGCTAAPVARSGSWLLFLAGAFAVIALRRRRKCRSSCLDLEPDRP
jgi:MYXO-CTERM domain-containing protein